MGELGLTNFQDIEMLEIPEDEDISVSSDTEGISGSNTPDESNLTTMFKSNKEYIELSQWLKTDEELQFQFDSNQYDHSLKPTSEFEFAFIEYTKSLYKLVDKLTKDVAEQEKEEEEEEPIGVITAERSIYKLVNSPGLKIDEAFQEIVEQLKQLIQVTGESRSEEASKLQHFLFILQCLGANYFYFDIKRKPELVLEWVNTFHPKPDLELTETIMISNPEPYSHPQFWNVYMAQLITRGLFTQATQAIEHSQYDQLEESCPELYSIISDLDTLLADYSSFALKGQFPQWKLLACEFRDSLANVKIDDAKYGIILTQIYDLASIISGLPKTISQYCDTWYEVYLALALYKVRDDDDLFPEYFQQAINEKVPPQYTNSSLEDISDGCYLDILERNFLKMLKTMHELEPTTTAYIAQLLELKGLLQGYYNIPQTIRLTNKTISEYFLVRHAYESLNIHDLVPVGLGILLNNSICRSSYSHNRDVIGDFLPEYQCRTNDDLEWALTICAQLNLITAAKRLYYNYGLKSLDEGYIYESLNNFVHCYDSTGGEIHQEAMEKVHFIIWDLIFLDSITNNRPFQDELINNLVTKSVATTVDMHPVIRQCLAPYAVLKAFFDSLEDDSIKFSVKLSKLLHLLRFNYMPKKFMPLLLSQFLPFLTRPSSEFLLPDLVVMVEVIDNFENETNEEELKDAADLYVYCINHFEEESTSYDWRRIVKDVPSDVSSLTKTLRNQIAARIAKVYVQ
ncbi:uncharacterized protein SPAPADRAFT_67664 [Spathaspora passalidarum NRRL Y-27907]|uniref:Nuclear pore complex protein Nup85 n=1 Tax=Spathaspora passalidarum (strain NRRL Y-27907 / 11-Y1) TaxID=619300 RepID=G3AQS8_SPAPN|nr:uncharacterized protein SPAPADRAFT_67664 [Spathaspora passalidarum NRRL Y-27907]EGW31625.1 hypothetical protein SPAPADRAFT_67664 [Spathaspora passalidarum NRRL Y-27907]